MYKIHPDCVVDAVAEELATRPRPDGLWIASSGASAREIRERAGLSRAKLAKALGVSPATIGRYERGEIDTPTGRFVNYAWVIIWLHELYAHPTRREIKAAGNEAHRWPGHLHWDPIMCELAWSPVGTGEVS